MYSLSLNNKMTTIEENARALLDHMAKKIADRPSANWQGMGDVDWEDLDFYVGKCKTKRDKESFDTALRVLEGLRYQILERKG